MDYRKMKDGYSKQLYRPSLVDKIFKVANALKNQSISKIKTVFASCSCKMVLKGIHNGSQDFISTADLLAWVLILLQKIRGMIAAML